MLLPDADPAAVGGAEQRVCDLAKALGFTFEAMLIAADGFKRAGTANGPELMRAIRATDIASHVMIGPPIKFDDKGQNVGIPSAAVQSRNRTPTVVLPATAATMTPVLPMPGWQGRS